MPHPVNSAHNTYHTLCDCFLHHQVAPCCFYWLCGTSQTSITRSYFLNILRCCSDLMYSAVRCSHGKLRKRPLVASLSRAAETCRTAMKTSLMWISDSNLHQRVCEFRYAKLERGLGEVDRARAIYVHASAMADPRRDTGFWADWNAFEVHSSCCFCCAAVLCCAVLCCAVLCCAAAPHVRSYSGLYIPDSRGRRSSI